MIGPFPTPIPTPIFGKGKERPSGDYLWKWGEQLSFFAKSRLFPSFVSRECRAETLEWQALGLPTLVLTVEDNAKREYANVREKEK